MSLQLADSFDFDDAPVGGVPTSWSIGETNPTTGLASWGVVFDPTAPSPPNVVALLRTENHDGTYNLAIAKNTAYRDLDLAVSVKAVSGEEDQGGGPIWRCRDENNYYVCRFNPLEDNFRLYLVKDGRRKQLDTAKVETEADRWYTVRVAMAGNHIRCYLDGKKLLDATDETFSKSGMVGFWTKADSVARFDDLRIVTPDASK